jgi:hypothetical protein
MTPDSMGPSQFKAIQDSLQSKLKVLAKDENFWNGYLVVNKKGELKNVGFFTYHISNLLKKDEFKLATKKEKKEATVKLLNNYKELSELSNYKELFNNKFIVIKNIDKIKLVSKKNGLENDQAVNELINKIENNLTKKTIIPAAIKENEPSPKHDAAKAINPKETNPKETANIGVNDDVKVETAVNTKDQEDGKYLEDAGKQLYQKGVPNNTINRLFSMSAKQKENIAPMEEDLRKLYNLQNVEYETLITPCAHEFLKNGIMSFNIDLSKNHFVINTDTNPPQIIRIPFSILAVLKQDKNAVQFCCHNKLQITPKLLQAANYGMPDSGKSEAVTDQFLNFLDKFNIPESNHLKLFQSFRSCESFQDIHIDNQFHKSMLERIVKVENNNFNKELYEYAKINAPKDQPLLEWLDTIGLDQALKTQATIAINKYSLPPGSNKDGYKEALKLRTACFAEPRTIGSLVCARDAQGVFTISDRYDPNAKLVFSSEKFESTIPLKRLEEALIRLNQENLVANCDVYCSKLHSVHTGGSGDTLSIYLGENGKFYSSAPDSFPSILVNFASSNGRAWGGDPGINIGLSGKHKLKIKLDFEEMKNLQSEARILQTEAVKKFIFTVDEEASLDSNGVQVQMDALEKTKNNQPLFETPFLTLIQEKWIENSPRDGFAGNFAGNKELLIELFTKKNISNQEVAKFLKDNKVRAEGGFLISSEVIMALKIREPMGVEEFYKKHNIPLG